MSEAKVGAETQAYCTTCRTMREHVIVAMVDKRPAKVECTECHKQHLYRAAPPGTKAAATSTDKKRTTAAKKRAEPSRPAAPTVDLAALIAGRTVRTYDPKVGFAVGDVVRHPSFGVGLVTQLAGPQKMEITFEGGAKVLAHDRAAAVAPTLTRPVRRDDDDRRLPSDAPPPARR